MLTLADILNAEVSPTTWFGEVTYLATATEDQVAQLVAGQLGVLTDTDGERMTVHTQVEASTLRWATELILRQAREAVRAAGVTGEPISVRVQAAREVQAELRRPLLPALAGVSEVAELLEVSPQRAGQLTARQDFPRPVARLAAGPVWTRVSVEAFAQRWPRRRTGRPRKTA